MARRKGWDDLSDAYRKRLEKNGIDRASYEGGASIKGARGHSKTPERPTQKITQAQYPQYFATRQRLENSFRAHMRGLFGQSAKWNPDRHLKNMRKKPPTLAQLKWAAQANSNEIINAIREDPNAYEFLCYH